MSDSITLMISTKTGHMKDKLEVHVLTSYYSVYSSCIVFINKTIPKPSFSVCYMYVCNHTHPSSL